MLRTRLAYSGLLVGVAAALAGCSRDPGRPSRAKRNYPTVARPATPSPPGPGRVKPAGQLEIPPDLNAPVGQRTLPKKGWQAYRNYTAGTFVAYETPKGALRREVFDLADHAAMVLNEVTGTPEMGGFRNRTASRLVFTEDTGDWPAPPVGAERKPAAGKRTVRVGERAVEIDTVYEVRADDQVRRYLYSAQVPLDGLVLIEDGAGNPVQRLTAFGMGPAKPTN